jgi:hypothetical protein
VIAPDRTEGTLPGGVQPLADHSFLANRALWDDWFLSGIAPQRAPAFSRNMDQRTLATEFFTARTPLPVARYLAVPDGQNVTSLVTSFFSGSLPNDRAVNQVASYLRVDGLFNVNSTSVEAWKVMLGGLKGRQVVVRDQNGVESISPARPNTPVANLSGPANLITQDESMPRANSQWTGRRELTEAEIDELARAIVREVRKRGPFLSLADFVNRRVGTDKQLAKSGAIQSALDSREVSINRNQNSDRAVTAAAAQRFAFPEAELGALHYGAPSVVKQGDILTPIAPVLSARSDSFIIRSYGEALDGNGKVMARAWCEAVVERDRNFIDMADSAVQPVANLTRPLNRAFGRKFKVTAFRWLHTQEI